MIHTIQLQCPKCGSSSLSAETTQFDCRSCHTQFPIEAEIPSFLLQQHDETCRQHYEEKSRGGEGSARTVGYLSERYHRAMQAQVKAMLPRLRNSTVLDVGCGHGAFSEAFTRSNRVVGVDFARGMLQSARMRGLEVFHADAMNLPFADEQFDLAICIEVIQHLENPMDLFREMTRVVKPDGLLLISSPNAAALTRRTYRLLHRFRSSDVTNVVQLPRLRRYADLKPYFSSLPLALECTGVLYFPSSLGGTVKSPGWLRQLAASNFVLQLRRTTPRSEATG